MAEEHDVAIVGAGMAGLACAQRLSRAHLDFLVLEAGDRVGGRVLTDYSLAGGPPLELGALMVHGRRAATHALLREVGLHERPLPVMRRSRFSSGGLIASFPTMAFPFHPPFGPWALYNALWRIPRDLERYHGPEISLAEFLEQEAARPGARLIITLLNAHAAAAKPEDIGVKGPAQEGRLAAETFGFANFQILEGYAALARALAAPLADRIRLSTRVTSIDYSGDGVRLHAGRDDGTAVEVRARRAVVTLPLGVLKANAVAFDPPIPPAKRRAIESLGFGQAIMVQMRLGGGNLVEVLGDFALLWGGQASTFHRPYVGLRGHPDVLGAFTVGHEALERSNLPDGDLVEATLGELQGILPRRTRPGTVEGSAVHRWPLDPLARGAYSYLPPGTTVEDRRALAEPVDGVLFFAGEATHTHGESSTVHGAVETGWRAAAEVLRSLRQG